MATLREYFDTGFPHALKVHQGLKLKLPEEEVEVVARLHFDFDSGAMFASFYVPPCVSPAHVCGAIVTHPEWALNIGGGVRVEAGFLEEDRTPSSELVFTQKVWIYCDAPLSEQELAGIKQLAKRGGVTVQIRGPKFAVDKTAIEVPLAFISHDSRDKDDVARPLASELRGMLCPVWYDEFSLRVGQRLRESIEAGLKSCRHCVLILSPNFLQNSGWTKVEFNSVFTREIIERRNVVLPVWHDVTAKEVFDYSPSLADRVALKWEAGVKEVARKLYHALHVDIENNSNDHKAMRDA
jgi:hypothetical protein